MVSDIFHRLHVKWTWNKIAEFHEKKKLIVIIRAYKINNANQNRQFWSRCSVEMKQMKIPQQ